MIILGRMLAYTYNLRLVYPVDVIFREDLFVRRLVFSPSQFGGCL